MGVKEDIEESLKDRPVTKIDGQPNNKELTSFKKELSKIAASVPTSLRGGKHGHLGLVMKATDYTSISQGGAAFDIPTHPGAYPATVSADPAAGAREEVEHKAKIREYEVCAGVEQALKDKIVQAIDPDWPKKSSMRRWASRTRPCSR